MRGLVVFLMALSLVPYVGGMAVMAYWLAVWAGCNHQDAGGLAIAAGVVSLICAGIGGIIALETT